MPVIIDKQIVHPLVVSKDIEALPGKLKAEFARPMADFPSEAEKSAELWRRQEMLAEAIVCLLAARELG